MSRQTRTFTLFTLAYFFSEFYRSANAVLARDLSAELGLDAAQLGLLTSVLFAAFGLIQFPLGSALDRWGPRWVVSILMLVGAAGSLLVAGAQTFSVLALGRILVGLGISGILMGGLKAFSAWFPVNRYGTVAGAMVAIGSIGALVAASPLAWLNQQIGWRAVFAGVGGLMGVVAMMVMIGVRNAPDEASNPTQSGQSGSLLTIVRDLNFWRISMLFFVFNGAQYAFQGLWAGPYLLDVTGLSALSAGNIVLLLSLGMTVGYWLCGWLGDRIGVRPVVISGIVASIVCFGLLTRSMPVVGVALVYLSLGLANSTLLLVFAQIRLLYPLELIGRASSAANFFVFAGVFTVQWLFGLLLDRYPTDAAGHYPPAAYSTSFWVIVVAALAAAVFYWPLLRRKEGRGQMIA